MIPEGNYPPTFLRGIPHKGPQYFDNQGEVLGHIFRPHDRDLPEAGVFKVSINWEDDATVEDFTLRAIKDDGTLHYNGGAARVSLEKINLMRQEPPYVGTVGYQRDAIRGVNEYHGNLLLNEDRARGSSRAAFFRRLKFTVIDVIPPIE